VIHVEDICEAVYCSLVAPEAAVCGKVFNVGQNSENYRVRELAQIVAEVFPGCSTSVGSSAGDLRSYRVNFDLIHRELPGFKCRYTARDGARQLRAVFERIRMEPETYQFRAFTRLKQLEYLQTTKQVDASLYWC
jgi:nucleoside-diphosphate-sugar epimerase